MAVATMHWRNQSWLRLTLHSRDNPVLILQSRLGRRRRVSVIIVGQRGIGRMNAGNESRRKERQETVTRTDRLGMGQGISVGQRCTALLLQLSPIQLSHKSY